jgi:hypothetical protein
VGDIDSTVGIVVKDAARDAAASPDKGDVPVDGFFTFAVRLESRAEPVSVVCKVNPNRERE